MLTGFIYNEKDKSLVPKQVLEDDRTYQVRCVHGTHEFAPGSQECQCGKFTNLDGLRK